jgi:hypothetical protein
MIRVPGTGLKGVLSVSALNVWLRTPSSIKRTVSLVFSKVRCRRVDQGLFDCQLLFSRQGVVSPAAGNLEFDRPDSFPGGAP